MFGISQNDSYGNDNDSIGNKGKKNHRKDWMAKSLILCLVALCVGVVISLFLGSNVPSTVNATDQGDYYQYVHIGQPVSVVGNAATYNSYYYYFSGILYSPDGTSICITEGYGSGGHWATQIQLIFKYIVNGTYVLAGYDGLEKSKIDGILLMEDQFGQPVLRVHKVW